MHDDDLHYLPVIERFHGPVSAERCRWALPGRVSSALILMLPWMLLWCSWTSNAMSTTDAPAIPSPDIGHHRLPCSICGKGERDTALSVTVESDRVVWICFRCGSKGARGRDGISGPLARPIA